MRYGIMSACLPGEYPEVIEASGRIGFDGVELNVGADYEGNMLWDSEARADLKKLLSQHDLALSSICLGTFWTYSFASPEADVRARGVDFTVDAIHWCVEFGAETILVPITPGAEGEGEEAVQRWIEQLRQVAPEAERSQVYLALENVGRGCGRTAEALLRLVEGVNSPYVQVYYDFANGLGLSGDPVGELHRLSEHIVQIHAKDREGAMGHGKVDMPGVAEAIREIGYDRWLVLETFEALEAEDPVAATKKNLEFARRTFG
ncbi:MAG: sugar phosphate isomerase/epimerase [Armatimonadetes bacterium]|nr:sugar phosphate isomerase/epimerase [Armatimonadota bacterium]